MSPLQVKMNPRKNGAGANSVRKYLVKLLETLLDEEEGFSGKRPFGDSGWMMELQAAFITSGLMDGKLDEDGYVEWGDPKRFQQLLKTCIRGLA